MSERNTKPATEARMRRKANRDAIELANRIELLDDAVLKELSLVINEEWIRRT